MEDFDLTYVTIAWSTTTFLRREEPEDFVQVWDGLIRYPDEDDEPANVGTVRCYLVEAENEAYDAFTVFDELDNELADYFPAYEHLAAAADERYDIHGVVFILHSIELNPAYRGMDIAHAVVQHVLAFFDGRANHGLIKPFPMYLKSDGTPEQELALDLAKEKLRRHWQPFIKSQLGDSDFFELV